MNLINIFTYLILCNIFLFGYVDIAENNFYVTIFIREFKDIPIKVMVCVYFL